MGNEVNFKIADWAVNVEPSIMQTSLSARNEDFISFDLGTPTLELIPKERFQKIIHNVFTKGNTVFQYAPSLPELKHQIVRLMKLRGIECNEKQILITAGAQQAINLVIRLLLNPKEEIIVEELAYPGFLQTTQPLQPIINTIPTDPETGLDTDALELYLKSGKSPAFFYTVPNGHNPTGSTLSHEKRVQVINLACKYKFPIIEDDAYGFIHYETSPPLPLRYFNDQWVIYIGSFSKILAPSLRVGWIIAPESFIAKLETLKEAADINTATFSQRVLLEFLENENIEEHLDLVRRHYLLRRDNLVAALQQYLVNQTFFTVPKSGFFIWLKLMLQKNCYELKEKAIKEKKVSFMPGLSFALANQENYSNCIRLSFSGCELEQISEGIKRLATLI